LGGLPSDAREARSEAIMLDGNRVANTDSRPGAYTPPAPRAPYSAGLLEALAALENPLRTILPQTGAPPASSGIRYFALKCFGFAWRWRARRARAG
jgi:hypothetical protein